MRTRRRRIRQPHRRPAHPARLGGLGRASADWDAACLWSGSLQVPALADRVLNEFADVLNTGTGQLSRLMLCANVARPCRRMGKAGPLTDAMEAAASELLASLI